MGVCLEREGVSAPPPWCSERTMDVAMAMRRTECDASSAPSCALQVRETCPWAKEAAWSTWSATRLAPTRRLGGGGRCEGASVALAFAKHGRLLASASRCDGRVRVFDAASGTVLLHFDAGHRDKLLHVAWNDQADAIYTVGRDGCARSHALRRDAATVLVPQESRVVSCAGRHCVLVGCADGKLRERDLRCRDVRVVAEGRGACASLDVPEDANIAAVGLEGGRAGVLDRRKCGNWLETWRGRGGKEGPTHAVKLARGGRTLLADVAGVGTRIYELGKRETRGECLGHLNGKHVAAQMAVFGQKEEYLAVGSRNRDIFVYHLDTGALVDLLKHPEDPNQSNSTSRINAHSWDPLHDEQVDMERLPRLLRLRRMHPAGLVEWEAKMPILGQEPQVAATGCRGMFAPAFASCGTNQTIALWSPDADLPVAQGLERAPRTIHINACLSHAQLEGMEGSEHSYDSNTFRRRFENCTVS